MKADEKPGASGDPLFASTPEGLAPSRDDLVAALAATCRQLDESPLAVIVSTLNAMRQVLHEYGPFTDEPVDCVQWLPADHVLANNYNPNAVAPPEMALLELSIEADGFTQPIVGWDREDVYEVVDGFHRNRVARECEPVRTRLQGYLPLAIINADRADRGDRIASTIRHNRARGKHQVTAMSEIVLELKRRNWSNKKIGKHLGMDPDEVLRLSQITGLAEMFADRDFSEAWEAEQYNQADGDDGLDPTEERPDGESCDD